MSTIAGAGFNFWSFIMTLLRCILIQILLTYSSQKEVRACEEPPDIDFGYIVSGEKSEYVESDRVQYRCYPGYTLIQSEWITCNGSWTPPPKCLAPCTITKQQLEDKNMFLRSGRRRTVVIQSAQIIEFSCSKGYKLTTPSVRACVDGHIHFPLCISEMGKKCGHPPTIANGDITTFALKEYASGFSVEYKCQRFYTLTGQNTSFCNNGNWTKPPVCLEPCAVSITEMQSRGVELSGSSKGKEYICHGELVEFKCQLGYALPALSSTSNFTARCHSGQISYPQCNKDLLKSDSPPYIENGVLSSDLLLEYEAGSTVEYKCRRFYTVKGSKIVTCHLGKWRDLPTCLEPCIVIKEDMARNNVKLKWISQEKLEVPINDFVEFACKLGYQLDPVSSGLRVQCLEKNLTYPKCRKRDPCMVTKQDMTRNHIQLKWIAREKLDVPGGDFVEFKCESGHELDPVSSQLRVQCLEKNLTYPTCRKRSK